MLKAAPAVDSIVGLLIPLIVVLPGIYKNSSRVIFPIILIASLLPKANFNSSPLVTIINGGLNVSCTCS